MSMWPQRVDVFALSYVTWKRIFKTDPKSFTNTKFGSLSQRMYR